MESISQKYTVISLESENYLQKIENYLKNHLHQKTSYCRFYLRGICIMKKQYCKFAHSWKELKIQDFSTQLLKDCSLNQKQKRKKMFQNRYDFQQKALFILKNVDYHNLYAFQFEQRMVKSDWKPASLEQIKLQRTKRIRIRQIMHRQNWDHLINYLEVNFPYNFTRSFLSNWFTQLGFEKPQTRCRFCDFIKYMINQRNYCAVFIIMPPRTYKSDFMIKKQPLENFSTYLHENLENIVKIYHKQRQQERQQEKKKKEILEKVLPENFYYRFMCRYYMAGYCSQFQHQCHYSHSISALKFQLKQQFRPEYRQPPKSAQEKLNLKSLLKYYSNFKPEAQMEQFQGNYALRSEIRRKMHKELYSQFLLMLKKLKGTEILDLEDIQTEYNAAGFNHTDENKFGQLELLLLEMDYCKEEISLKNSKKTMVYSLPPLEELDKYYHRLIKQTIEIELNQNNSINILESSLRRRLYSHNNPFIPPLHIYLRLKNCSLAEILNTAGSQLMKYVCLQNGQSNYNLLQSIISQYFKTNKNYLQRVDQLEAQIKSDNRNNFNWSNFINFRQWLQISILKQGKYIHVWPFSSYILNLEQRPRRKQAQAIKVFIKPQTHPKRILIIQDQKTLEYARILTKKCNIFGVDLQGCLGKDGYIDLIQLSMINPENNFKQILIFDILKIKIQGQKINSECIQMLRQMMENQNKLKIFHDCRADTLALRMLMNINIRNVFDTSGMHIYLSQKKLYERSKQNHQNLLKKIKNISMPSLNIILDKWQAPNGINILKKTMKKKFEAQNNRQYFKQRPINEEYLEYSARDVEDLIEVYHKMIQQDKEQLSTFIGQIYSTAHI